MCRWADREESRSLGGNGMTEKRMPAAERQQETGTWWLAPPAGRPWITGRIPGLVPGPERVLTRSGEPVEKKMTEAPEPKDKLDTATAQAVVVSGPEDAALRWRQIDWRRAVRVEHRPLFCARLSRRNSILAASIRRDDYIRFSNLFRLTRIVRLVFGIFD